MEEWVLSRLKQNYKGKLHTDESSRQAASTDASIFKVVPSAVAVPEDVEDLKTLVRNVSALASEGQNISLTPRAAGTCMSGGPLSESIVVDMKPYFSWVGDVNVKEKSVWVGAGTYHRDVEAATAPHKLLFAPYTSSKDLCVIGGMVGNNASGEKSIRYGATVDNVMAVTMIAADGNEYEFGSISGEVFAEKVKQENLEGHIYRELDKMIEDNWDLLQQTRPKVRKNAAGYQLWRIVNKNQDDFNIAKLIVGAQGTLGIVTSVKLRLIEKFDHRRMLLIPINDLSQLALAVQTVLAHHPEGLETYDHHTYELAETYMPDEAKQAVASKGHHLVLMAQFIEHTKDQTDHYADVCKKALERKKFKVHTVTKDAEAEAHWRIRRASFKMLMEHPHKGLRAVPFIEDTIVSVEHYGEFLASLEAILSDYKMVYTYAGHIGDGSIRLIPLVNLEAPDAADQVFELARRTYDLTFAFGGSMSVDHNDGLIRTPFLPRMYGEEIMELFAETKYLFDPLNIFNPGKKVGMTEGYAKAHMIRTNKA
jgi:FAD/FMN-containing dehydrogenase